MRNHGRAAEVVHVELELDLSPLLAGWRIVGLDVGPDDDPLVQLVDTTPIDVPAAQQPASRLCCLHVEAARTKTLELSGMLPLFKFVQPLPRQQWLVVCPWAFANESGSASDAPRSNARIYSPDGTYVSSLWLGDDVSHVQARRDGSIWVGWGDEGMHGPHADPLSVNGLGWLAADRRWVFRFNEFTRRSRATQDSDERIFPMHDCTALNVSETSGVAVLYWTYRNTHRLVRLFPDGAARGWGPLAHAHADALALDGERLLLGMKHPEYLQYAPLRLFSLQTLDATLLHAVDHAGHVLQPRLAAGRGSKLWFISGTGVYRLDLEHI